MKRSAFITAFIITGFVTVAVSCKSSFSQNEPVPEKEVLPDDITELRADQVKLAGIELGSVEWHSIGEALRVNGIISVPPQNMATVSMPMGGFIKSTNLFPGNSVQKGQTLAVIENQEFVDIQQNFLEARNKLAYAEAEYKRHSDLYASDVYSEKNLQQVTMEYKNLQAEVRSLEQKLRLIGIDPARLDENSISSSVNLVSPIDGFLKSVNVNIGKYVSPTDVLFEIVNGTRLFLELTLFEKDADRVAKGQSIKFFINNETEEHEAFVTETGRSVLADKTVVVYGSVTSKCNNIFPGMYVNAIINESEKNVTALPSDAIVTFDDKYYIFTFSRDKEESGKQFTEYKMIEINKGTSSSGYTEVILPEGFDIKSARVVVKGAYNILSAKKNAGEMAC